jgi:hypothetical protein
MSRSVNMVGSDRVGQEGRLSAFYPSLVSEINSCLTMYRGWDIRLCRVCMLCRWSLLYHILSRIGYYQYFSMALQDEEAYPSSAAGFFACLFPVGTLIGFLAAFSFGLLGLVSSSSTSSSDSAAHPSRPVRSIYSYIFKICPYTVYSPSSDRPYIRRFPLSNCLIGGRTDGFV